MTASALDHAVATSLSPELVWWAKGRFRASWEDECLVIQGWVIGHRGCVVEVEIRAADRRVARVPVGVRRPDVAAGQAGASEECGFRVLLEAEGSGAEQLELYAVTKGGARVAFGVVDVERLPAADANSPGASPDHDTPIRWSVGEMDGGKCEQVLVGRDGWLFLRGDSNDVVGQHTGLVSLEERRQRAWARVLRGRMSIIDRIGATWVFLVVPDKESVYPEHLPRRVRPSSRRPIHDFMDVARSVGAPVTYLLDDLMAAKATGELYCRTDTHWNDRGAYVAYRRLCNELVGRGVAIQAIDESTLRWSEHKVPGDLGEKWYPDPIESPFACAESAQEERGRLLLNNEVHTHGRVMIFEQDEPTGLSCVVFGESFAEQVLPFLKETFRRLVFVHTSMVIEEVLEEEAPDLVLSLPVERFLLRVPDDRDALAQLERTAERKGGRLPWRPTEESNRT